MAAARDASDAQEVSRAIEASLQSRADSWSLSDPAVEDSLERIQSAVEETARSRNIDDCINDLLEVPLVPLPRLDIKGGDTWIFIRPPAQEPEQSYQIYQRILNRYEKPFLASSAVLKASESALILKQLDSPTQQFKIIRRFNVKKEMARNSIKYVLDLTPPVEGDEAVELTQELSCPPDILNWVYESEIYLVSKHLTRGTDEFLTPAQIGAQRAFIPTSPTTSGPQHDYSPVRHRVAIEGVLLSLYGHVKLDSAPKVYTAVMTATKHLQIPAYRLTSLADHVVTWLRAHPNSFIIELHPESVLKIADCLQIKHLCQDAFTILVGEAALDLRCQYTASLQKRQGFTIHSRPCRAQDEPWETRIQYARNSLAERVENEVFKGLLSKNMEWVETLPWVESMNSKFARKNKKQLTVTWLSHLKRFARSTIMHMLASRYSVVPDGVRDEAKNSDMSVFKRSPFINQHVFHEIQYKDRIFTRSFWKALQSISYECTGDLLSTRINIQKGFSINNASPDTADYQTLLAAGEIEVISGELIKIYTYDLMKDQEQSTEITSNSGTQQSSKGTDKAESPHKKRRVTWAEAHAQIGSHPRPEFVRTEFPATVVSPVSQGLQVYPSLKFENFLGEVLLYFTSFASRMLSQPNAGSLELTTVDVLTCLSSEELKFLPLWAEGMDDGSNGVFDGELPSVPETEAFGATDVRRGSAHGREFDDDGPSTNYGGSTIATSKLVNDGHSVIMDRRQVYAADELESVRYADSVSNACSESSWEEIGRNEGKQDDDHYLHYDNFDNDDNEDDDDGDGDDDDDDDEDDEDGISANLNRALELRQGAK